MHISESFINNSIFSSSKRFASFISIYPIDPLVFKKIAFGISCLANYFIVILGEFLMKCLPIPVEPNISIFSLIIYLKIDNFNLSYIYKLK